LIGSYYSVIKGFGLSLAGIIDGLPFGLT